ncbi:OB-fold domain-containing protein [Phenylobacterium sp.]|uniref:hydroxymethylglutaryl-CoA synthase family protein n=1 Tax=Phenylobacterium sp. TaxID=1871053 RepID=UPI00301CECE5
MIGIRAAGAYVPRLRLQRSSIAAAHAWFAPGLKALSGGERAMANWDEDAITMAVEAARDALHGRERDLVRKVILASTSHPFQDRLNAGVVKEALNLPDGVAALDIGGSQRAGTSALLEALESARAFDGDVLLLGAEKRRTQPGSELELTHGDAAAAFVIGQDELAAEFVGGHSLTIDFVDHFRSEGQDFDYVWESRWLREEGYAKIAPRALKEALARHGLAGADVSRFIMAAPQKGAAAMIAGAAGISASAVADDLAQQMGGAGAIQPLILLARALEDADAGELITVVGFGQGCDVLFFRATGSSAVAGLGVSGWLARRTPEANYVRYLTLAGHLAIDRGMRAEFDQKTPLAALYRNRKAVMGLVGGRCAKTGVVQFPKTAISVAQNARAQDTQEDYPLADRLARIVTHTADGLTYSPDPPCYYGAIEFEGGGRLTVEYADVEPGRIEVGAPVRMMFRVRAHDETRGFIKYFWKAVPDYRAAIPATLAAE